MQLLNWWPWPKSALFIVLLVVYLGIVQALRWRRYHEVHKKYGPRISSLTPAEAQQIIHLSSQWDMPALVTIALSFALFKTYAIPTISGLLSKTRQLGARENVSRRYADTEILITTWVTCPISGKFDFDPRAASGSKRGEEEEFDPRCAIAIARTNWLHGKYDIKWMKRYGWRELSELEKQAYFVFWIEVGRRMNITDIPQTLGDLERWSANYEEGYMIPAQTNHHVAQLTVDEFLWFAPEKFGIKDFLQRIVICMLEDRVRIAMISPCIFRYKEQPWSLHAIARGLTGGFAFFQRYCLLPRRSPSLFVKDDTPKHSPDSAPRMHPTRYARRPWYKPKPTSLGTFIERFTVAVGLVDAENVASPRNKCEGFRLEEIGPESFEKSGHEETMRIAGELQGCPVRGPWSLNPHKLHRQ
ncbi:hypothetical protein GLOTRDRAFT_46084 [Gloeophyllum trabeum ATCC 11539]|uniref:ER-bound oxygenase mpaB/mpaB'/Rubber oxygenase catalytic domain-containing protein n=1 Tax=Gloeophyllum trabeum (strain ATCC 11539 / FP-39264 / Madison 617) TaxID=670483 RepID=S7RGC4_GLOTA|nr:uncharacterized protein GLOTRDRAFT_46084 [Gloeophyllum trabeum ATCC 11539]EPQ53280.1 hypothetical protein GLOTRDRAFT_46084 [Gloeophyllum trabeum ATCC 11539]